jgi:DNA-formamidopyrimidine glycosylase
MDVTVHGGRYKASVLPGLSVFTAALGRGPFTVGEVNCKGKFMWWCLTPCWTLWCTYGMSGQWSTQQDKHCAVSVGYVDGAVYFNDPRHFGTLRFVCDPDGERTQAKLDSLGPDMLSDPPDDDLFLKRIWGKPDRTIAEALMDQSCVSGVGNYIKAESLYLAELSPHRRCGDLKPSELTRLRQQITNVMKASYNTGGATISTYRNPDGSKGQAQRRFVVYGNSHDPMGNPVVKEATKDGRTTHWCPTVQH